MARTKKEAERYFVEHVQEHYPGYLPTSKPEDCESPDFLIDDNGTTVGIEVTQLFKTGGATFPEKQVVAFQRKVVTRAQQIYDAQHPERPIYFAVYFHNGVPMQGLEACAKALADVAFLSDFDTHRQRIDSPKWLSVWTCQPEAQSRFVANGTSNGQLVTREWIAAEIARKNARVTAYRAKAERVILLIVSSLNLQSSVYAPRDFADWVFEFDFDEVFVLFQDPGEVFRVRHAAF